MKPTNCTKHTNNRLGGGVFSATTAGIIVRGHRFKTTWLALSIRAFAALDQSQKSECAAVKREAEEDWGEREMRPRKLSPKFISTALLLIAVFQQHRRKAIGTMAITVSNRGAITERPMVAVRNIAPAVGTSTVMVPPTVTQNKHPNRHHSRRRPVSGDGSGTSITEFALPPLLRHLIPAAKLPELLSR